MEWIRECQAGGDLRVTILGGGHRGPEAKEHGREKESHNVTKNLRNIACSQVKKRCDLSRPPNRSSCITTMQTKEEALGIVLAEHLITRSVYPLMMFTNRVNVPK